VLRPGRNIRLSRVLNYKALLDRGGQTMELAVSTTVKDNGATFSVIDLAKTPAGDAIDASTHKAVKSISSGPQLAAYNHFGTTAVTACSHILPITRNLSRTLPNDACTHNRLDRQTVRRASGGRQFIGRNSPWRHLRDLGPERRRQDHHDSHGDEHHRARCGKYFRARKDPATEASVLRSIGISRGTCLYKKMKVLDVIVFLHN